MESALAVPRLPPHDPGTPALSVVDMHTGGEPLRIVLAGCPEVVGPTLLAKRRYLRQHLDHVRRRLVWEPRGHRDMYGAVLVPSELPDAHLGVLFLHNEGYSSMCGHAVLALGRFALDFGLVPAPPLGAREARVNIHCPCGLVAAFVACEGGRSRGPVRFHSVPAFVLAAGNAAQAGTQVPGLHPARRPNPPGVRLPLLKRRFGNRTRVSENGAQAILPTSLGGLGRKEGISSLLGPAPPSSPLQPWLRFHSWTEPSRVWEGAENSGGARVPAGPNDTLLPPTRR